MSLLQEAIDACAALARRVEHLEYDKVAQALEITKLKKRVKKLEKRNKGRMIAEIDKDDAVVLMDDKEEDKKVEDAKEDETEPAIVQEVVIYVSCIKQFWTTVVVKKVNDVIRLQALVDKKKVVVMKATIRQDLHLDDAEGVECLPNEEIFAELARMGYKKPSTKLTFYKAFFLSQWKFLIHAILQYMSSKRTSWNEFSSLMASAIICLSLVGNLLTHTTKYTSPALTQKVFTNMQRVGKGFFGVETPLFEGMLVAQEIVAEGDAEVLGEKVNASDAVEGDVTTAHGEVLTVAEEPSIPSPTPPTPLPQPSHDIPSTSQAQPTPPQSPQMKRRVKKLERRNKVKVLKLRRLPKVRTLQRVETSDETVMDDDEAKEVAKDAKVDESVDIHGRQAESQAKIYQIDLDHANKVLSMQEDEIEPSEV
nr:hypothetical protein [Tanacetum cinerariifolium]